MPTVLRQAQVHPFYSGNSNRDISSLFLSKCKQSHFSTFMVDFPHTFPHLPTSRPYPLPPAMALIHHEGGRGAVPGGEGGRRVRHAQPAVGEGAAVGFALEQTFVRQAGLAGWQDGRMAGCWFGEYVWGFLCLLEDSFEGVLGILRIFLGGFHGDWFARFF